MDGWADILGPAVSVGLVSTFLTLLLRGDLRLSREVTRVESDLSTARAKIADLEKTVTGAAATNAELQAATAETARQQAAVIEMLMKRQGGS